MRARRGLRQIRFAPSAAEQRRQVQGALDYYAAMSGGERIDVGAKPKRAPKRPTNPVIPYERQVLSAVLKYLSLHKMVAFVGRINSGGATDHTGQFVRFHTLTGCSDIIGMLKSGHFLALECKRPGNKPTEAQQAFLDRVSAHGGCSGYATSLEDCDAILDAWRERNRAITG
jgi:hypothetical protein